MTNQSTTSTDDWQWLCASIVKILDNNNSTSPRGPFVGQATNVELYATNVLEFKNIPSRNGAIGSKQPDPLLLQEKEKEKGGEEITGKLKSFLFYFFQLFDGICITNTLVLTGQSAFALGQFRSWN